MNTLFMVGPVEILVALTGLIGIILPVLALIDILTGRFEQNDKLIWVILVIIIPIIGAILYFTLGRKQKIRS